ncbi:MAG: hypothetical protein MUC59_09815 [Saprospiraceae bacterium]|nr:hypothetical protein [Saprospiraceae bacterium]
MKIGLDGGRVTANGLRWTANGVAVHRPPSTVSRPPSAVSRFLLAEKYETGRSWGKYSNKTTTE